MERQSTNRDISWFLDLDRKGALNLDPSYQRRSVWTRNDRRYFIDTIFNNFPCPQIFLHKEISDEGIVTYHVVDGKQRLETIIKFTKNEFTLSKDMNDTRLAGKKWKDIDIDMKKNFWDYPIPIEMLNSVEGTLVNEIFDRLNRNTKKLERQELRHARFDGWFINKAEAEAAKEEWKHLGVVTTARAKRMKDVQFISELLLVVLEREIVGFDPNYLDDMYAEYDDPDDTRINFSEDEFTKQVEEIKKYLLQMDIHREKRFPDSPKYGRTFGNFYTLWSIVALSQDDLPKASIFADRYNEFMSKVDELGKADEPEELLGSNKEKYRNPFNYFINMRGATTEFPQRTARDEALKDEILQG